MSPTDELVKSAADRDVDTGGDESAEPVFAEDESPPSAKRGRRISRRGLIAAVGAALLMASTATAVVVGLQLRQQRAVDNAAQQALAAAQQYAVILTKVDTTKLDENFAAVLDGSTGEFKDMYSQSSSQLKQVLLDSKAKADGKVIAAGVKSATTDKVVVMLFLDQSVTNALNPEPRLDRNRLILTMEKVNGRWLASDVELP